MANTNTGLSKRLGLAIATAVTGVVLAAGVSVGSLLGWVKPAEAGAGSVQNGIATQAEVAVTAPTAPQVVLVPITPTSPHADPVALTNPAAQVASPASHGERQQRSAVVRAPHGERDDD